MTKYKLELESPRSNMIVSRIAKKNGCLTFCLSPGCRRIESDKRKHLQSWELSLTELRSCFFPPNCFTVVYLFNFGDYIIIVAGEWKTHKLHNTDHQKLAQLLMQMWLRVLTGNWRSAVRIAAHPTLRTRCGVHRLTCRALATPLMPQLSGQTKLIWN